MVLLVGESASMSKTISESDVYMFAGLTGDYNSVHINKVEAEKSIFKDRVVHGMLVGSMISSVLGTKLPGEGTIYLEQDLKFIKPVFYEDTLTATVKIESVLNSKKGIYKLNTVVKNQLEQIVVDGHAVVMNANYAE